MEEKITNMQKYETYKILKEKLKKALDNEFWLEASMIEYSIMEDRLSSILDHARICENAYDSKKMLKNKLNSIAHQIGKENPALKGKIDTVLIEDINKWREQRNTIVHRSCIRVYNSEEIKQIAEEGKMLVDKLNNAARRVRYYCDKHYGQEAEK